MDYLANAFVTTGIGFGIVALGLYVEARWIGLSRPLGSQRQDTDR